MTPEDFLTKHGFPNTPAGDRMWTDLQDVLEVIKERHWLAVHENASVAINSVYGTDLRHSYMALRITRAAFDGEPLPWDWDRMPDEKFEAMKKDYDAIT
jgi:hypothetical protein